MFLPAAHRNVILLPLIFLIGVWIGQSRLIDWSSEEQASPKKSVIRSELEQRTSEKHVSSTAVAEQQEADLSLPLTNTATCPEPAIDHSESEPIYEFSDMLVPVDENTGESYSFLLDTAQEGTSIEPSPESITDDIIRSLEETGIPPEEVSNNVENLMGMILQVHQQTPEAYPSISE